MSEYKNIKKTCCKNLCNLSFKIIISNLFLSLIRKLKLFLRKDDKLNNYMQLLLNILNCFRKILNNILKIFFYKALLKNRILKY